MCAIVDHVGFTCPCGRGGQLLRAIEGYASYFGRGSYPKFSFVIQLRKGGVGTNGEIHPNKKIASFWRLEKF